MLSMACFHKLIYDNLNNHTLVQSTNRKTNLGTKIFLQETKRSTQRNKKERNIKVRKCLYKILKGKRYFNIK